MVKTFWDRFRSFSGRLKKKAAALPLLALLVVLVAVLARPGPATGQFGETAVLFKELPGESEFTIPTGFEHVTRHRPVLVNLALLGQADGKGVQSGRALTLNLFPGVNFMAEPSLVESPSPGKITWQGTIAAESGGTVIFTISGEAAAGTVQAGGKLYQLSYAGGGRHLLVESGAFEPLPEYPPVVIPSGLALKSISPLTESDKGLETIEALVGDDGSVIDILVAYTPAARSSQGSTAGMQAHIDLAIAETNQAYQNSQINTRLNLVLAAEVNYSESGDIVTDLSRLQANNDGYMDEVHGWRDSLDADMVSLINVDTSFCGVGYLMTGLSNDFERLAFTVVHVNCATGYYSFAHELGHNMGSAHDRANAGVSLYDYSFGYQAPDRAFRTIMAYDCSEHCPRVQYFSNPWVNFGGQPTGIDHNSNPANSADNARSINNARFTVANWRDSSPPLPDPPLAPDTLVANAASFHQINLNWQNKANNADGIIVERRPAGGIFRIVAVLPASQNSHNDDPLAGDSSYDYRVRAYNLGGSSSYSNVASATTFIAPHSLFISLLNR